MRSTEHTHGPGSGGPGHHNPWTTPVRITGRLLCLNLALAMATAATQAIAAPTAAWWSPAWVAPWLLQPALLAAWAALRRLEKRHTCRTTCEDRQDRPPGPTGYGRAA
ncbi:hypothetical protein [Streptomyces sp. NPDC050856]|uniref:hypothetical protein n=1 Tax=Streptomyces sp. NPDC050856 TaxID=3154939 RepID=UPI00340DD802